MYTDEKTLRAIADKAAELGEALTNWAREELKLPIGDVVVVDLSIERRVAVDISFDRRDWVYNRQPTREHWEDVFRILNEHTKNADNRLWSAILEHVKELQKSNNSGYVWGAGRINAFFKTKGYPYKIVRMNNSEEPTRHSLFVARQKDSTPT